MNSRLSDFLADRARETYPEPRSEGHDGIIATVCPMIAERLEPGAFILDVGCGQGSALQWFKQHKFPACGFGINDEDLAKCAELNLTATKIDMHAIPPDLLPVDCVFARHVLEHSIAPFFVLHEFARVLKPGGLLYVEVPAPDTACLHDCNNLNHYSVLGFKMWHSLIQRAGFTLVNEGRIKLQTGAGPDEYFAYLATKA